MKGPISRGSCAVLAVAALLVLAGPARPCRSDLIEFTYAANGPGVSGLDGVNGSLTYDSTSQDFNATVSDSNALTLFTPTYSDPSNPNVFTAGFFDGGVAAGLTVDVQVDNNGNLVNGVNGFTLFGAVDIDGDGNDDVTGTSDSPLLTGSIVAFGADNAGPPTINFNGLFQVTGGSLTGPLTLTNGDTISALFPAGSTDGFTFSAEDFVSGILGDFTEDFSSDNLKPEFGAVVPEPGSVIYMVSGTVVLGGFLVLRRRNPRPRR